MTQPEGERCGSNARAAALVWCAFVARMIESQRPTRRLGGSAVRETELADWARDAEAVRIDRVNVVGGGIYQSDVVAGAREKCTQRAADRPRAPDQESHAPQAPSSSARVSSTATCRSARTSASERW